MLRRLAWLAELLGLSPSGIKDPDSLEDRLKMQKAVFLLRHLKVKPFRNYDFNMYLRGPYSPELASDYYRLEGVEPVEGADVEIIKWFVSHKPRWLEIASSILWIKEACPRSKPKEIYSILTLSKPWVGEKEFRRILRELKEKSLIN